MSTTTVGLILHAQLPFEQLMQAAGAFGRADGKRAALEMDSHQLGVFWDDRARFGDGQREAIYLNNYEYQRKESHPWRTMLSHCRDDRQEFALWEEYVWTSTAAFNEHADRLLDDKTQAIRAELGLTD